MYWYNIWHPTDFKLHWVVNITYYKVEWFWLLLYLVYLCKLANEKHYWLHTSSDHWPTFLFLQLGDFGIWQLGDFGIWQLGDFGICYEGWLFRILRFLVWYFSTNEPKADLAITSLSRVAVCGGDNSNASVVPCVRHTWTFTEKTIETKP